MLATSAALAALLFGAYFLTPVIQLRYHAWMFHRHKGDNSSEYHLERASQLLVSRQASESQIAGVLGIPSNARLPLKPEEMLGPIYLFREDGHLSSGYQIVLREGRAAESRRVGWDWQCK
jgi:hypothetical protein